MWNGFRQETNSSIQGVVLYGHYWVVLYAIEGSFCYEADRRWSTCRRAPCLFNMPSGSYCNPAKTNRHYGTLHTVDGSTTSRQPKGIIASWPLGWAEKLPARHTRPAVPIRETADRTNNTRGSAVRLTKTPLPLHRPHKFSCCTTVSNNPYRSTCEPKEPSPTQARSETHQSQRLTAVGTCRPGNSSSSRKPWFPPLSRGPSGLPGSSTPPLLPLARRPYRRLPPPPRPPPTRPPPRPLLPKRAFRPDYPPPASPKTGSSFPESRT